MNKALFFCFTLFFMIVSCQKDNHNNPTDAAAGINTISVIIDDQLWYGEVGDSIRNKFASPVYGLPQEEPLFTLNQYPVKLFEGFSTDCRNIIIVKKEPKKRFEIKENEFAAPQITIHISGRTSVEILEVLEKNASKIIQKIRTSELAEFQKNIKLTTADSGKISSKFAVSLNIPVKYHSVFESKDFIWFKKEITSGNASILIYQFPLEKIDKSQNPVNEIVKIRDSIGNLFIHGTLPQTKMVTENAYAPYFTKVTVAGLTAFETKGNWELKNDYMSGPFINYAVIDSANNRVLVLEGFCYAPSKEKRDLMFELEAIIKTVDFNINK